MRHRVLHDMSDDRPYIAVVELDEEEVDALLGVVDAASPNQASGYGAPLGRALAKLEQHTATARPAPPGVAVTALHKVIETLGRHDGDPMSLKPHIARQAALDALDQLGQRPEDDLSRPARPA